MVVKTKRFHKRKSQVASRNKTMKGGSSYIPHQKLRPPKAFSIINSRIATQSAQNSRFGFLKNKFYKNKALEHKKLKISAPTDPQSGHFNGSKFVFHHNNQPSKVLTVPEMAYNGMAHYQGNSPMQPTGKMIEYEV